MYPKLILVIGKIENRLFIQLILVLSDKRIIYISDESNCIFKCQSDTRYPKYNHVVREIEISARKELKFVKLRKPIRYTCKGLVQLILCLRNERERRRLYLKMPVPKLAKSKKHVTTAKEIKEDQVDSLVEELLGGNKKLTKAQQQKKRELEAYLLQKLQQYDEEDEDTVSTELSGTEDSESDSESESSYVCEDCSGSDGENDSATDSSDESESGSDADSESGSSEDDTGSSSDDSCSDSDSECNCSKRSDQFTDEYTINSYSDESDYS